MTGYDRAVTAARRPRSQTSSSADGAGARWLDDVEGPAWRAFVEASVALLDVLDRELLAKHGLSLRDYEVLVRLSEAPGRRLRMTELASQIQDSASCLSHRVDRLVRDGLVTREPDPEDRRGRYARLTGLGMRKLARARRDHVADVRRLFVDRLSASEMRTAERAFGRISAGLAEERQAGSAV